MIITRKIICISASLFGFINVIAAPEMPVLPGKAEQAVFSPVQEAPQRSISLFFKNQRQEQTSFKFGNVAPGQQIEFSIRKDNVVTHAVLHLRFIPSPALIPGLSQLKVYLNDELVNVLSISEDQLGKSSSADLPIDPRFINDFNRLRIELIGHYKAICENPAHSSVWVSIDKFSNLELTLQTLMVQNDLSHFPQPFFDSLDTNRLRLPIVFSGQPDLMQQRAAAILASWFGTKALWRGISLPVLYNQLPDSNAVVLATNDQRPDFLKNHIRVNAPTVEMISHPNNPYVKLLLVLGRDDTDLITAVKGIAQGNILFRGQSVIVDKVRKLKPRQPYDAPNWIRTDRPVSFAQLQEFREQFESKGFGLYPIFLRFNLPPDLYLNYTRGLNLHLKYRYSQPPEASTSLLDITWNDNFVKSYMLVPGQGDGDVYSLQETANTSQKLYIPADRTDVHNLLMFAFKYGSQITGGIEKEHCTTYTLVDNYGAIDGSSTLDFSNYYHYITMPNLRAFIDGGFPFSRMADLSETTVLVNYQPNPEAVTALLNTIAHIGAETGYPALGMTLSDSWSEIKDKDSDLLVIGRLPEALRNNQNINVLLDKTQDWVKQPFNQNTNTGKSLDAPAAVPESQTSVNAIGSKAVILGLQSPKYDKRSIVIMLAQESGDFDLLNKAISDPSKHSDIFGSVAVIRNSGIESLRVGTAYHLGYLPWWQRLWISLQKHPVSLAFMSLLAAIIVTFLLWRFLLVISNRRLKGQGDKE